MDVTRRAAEHFFAGLEALNAGDLPAAETQLLKALDLAPGRPSVLVNLSIVRARQGRSAEAVELATDAVRQDPREPLFWLQKGAAELAFEAHEAALASLDSALALKAELPEIHLNRGTALRKLKRIEEAIASYDRAIQLKPDHAEAYSDRGAALRECKRLDAAIASYETAISLKPDDAGIHMALGNAWTDMNRLEQALACFDRAVALVPRDADAHLNRGTALKSLNRDDEALASFDEAVSLRPDYAEAHYNRANTLWKMGRREEALASFDRALSLKPSYASARYNKAFIVLQQGDFREGFDLLMSRWDTEEFDERHPSTDVPEWDGHPRDGEILLWAEQGIGDEVFYSSLLSLIASDAGRIALSADLRLHPVLQRSFPEFRLLDRRAMARRIEPGFAAQAPMGNLGYLLKVDRERIGQRRYPFLKADSDRTARIRKAHWPVRRRPVCGISWKSGNKKLGVPRSVGLADLAPLLSSPGIDFVNLQYGDVSAEIAAVREQLGRDLSVIPDLDVFNDIDGLISLIDACDLVFTIDNVTAHLAGAIGKPAIVLIPAGPGRYWYWGGERQSLWYPSLELIYQQRAGAWADTIADAARLARQRLLGAAGDGAQSGETSSVP